MTAIWKQTTFDIDKVNDIVTITLPPGARLITRHDNRDDMQQVIIQRAWKPGDPL
ncbi:hypothetical protein SEA_GAIL_73 [Mycobacterium phage Gail]|uniref:Uncharacterized protein n=1 Tax=Mycobacterium phage Gail TaxID=2743994 RepID=A0A7D5K7J4_9CAUD|nr:hypothetical protein KNV16_gp036 [Mycobacterium phage Gail]QLF84637.1 hypothetical protein SEA_GAIL_73 [Mycobacterium phage Gail]